MEGAIVPWARVKLTTPQAQKMKDCSKLDRLKNNVVRKELNTFNINERVRKKEQVEVTPRTDVRKETTSKVLLYKPTEGVLADQGKDGYRNKQNVYKLK